MDVILLERIQNLGDLGDEVRVKPGYARNYLIPQKKAMRATEDARAKVEERRIELAKIAEDRLAEAKAISDKAVKTITLKRLAGEEGKLFGSVTPVDIAEAVSEGDVQITRAEITMPEGPIKQVGEFQVEVILHPEVRFPLTVTVEAEETE